MSRRLERGQDVCLAGERTAKLYVVVEGLFISKAPAEGGHLAELLGPGDIVNPEALAAPKGVSTCCASVTAMTPARVRGVSLTTLSSVIARDSAVSMWLAGGVSQRIRRVESHRLLRTDSSASDAVSLVAWLLLRLRTETGSDFIACRGREGISQSRLAELVGMSRETVNRALGLMRHRGWIQFSGDSLSLLDVPALERRARHALAIAPVQIGAPS